MNHRLLLSVAAAALIAGGAAANAQSSSSGSSSSSGGAATSAPSVGQSAPAPSGAGASQMQRSDSDRPGSSREAPAMDRSANDATKGVSDHDRDRSKMKAEDRNERSGNRNADNDRDHDSKMQRGADNDRDHDRNKQRGADNDRDRSSTTTGQAGARAQLSTEQRTKITTVIKNQHIEPQTNVNFSISVGTRVPREVHFHPLPTEIVTVYPDWRGYEFFMVRDEIVVVNPRTLEIVAVLDI